MQSGPGQRQESAPLPPRVQGARERMINRRYVKEGSGVGPQGPWLLESFYPVQEPGVLSRGDTGLEQQWRKREVIRILMYFEITA